MNITTQKFHGDSLAKTYLPWNLLGTVVFSRIGELSPVEIEMQKLDETRKVYFQSVVRRLEDPCVTFDNLADKWERETKFSSSTIEMVLNPSYQKIIAMGKQVIPFILNRLKSKPDHWFWALEIISDQNPVPESKNGNFNEMVEAWLDWGKVNGFIE